LLLVLWLNGEPGIWDIDSEGQPSPHLDRQILFEGSVALHAHLIWDALKDSPLVQGARVDKSPEKSSYWLMEESTVNPVDPSWQVRLGQQVL